MTRPLEFIAAQPTRVLEALRDALAGGGPAILPRQMGADSAGAAPSVPNAPSAAPAVVPRHVALVVETSGSTAKPKHVALSADALLASAAASDGVLGGAGQWLLALPVHYIAGLNVLVRSIAAGTEPVMLPAGSFDPLAFARAADELDAPLRFTSLVPAQLGQLLEADAALPALRRFDRILVGGQSTPVPLRERARELGLRLTLTYGSSETSGGCVYDGVPIGNTVARVVDGEIQLGGGVLADGYLGEDLQIDAARSAMAFPSEGGQRWYRTGDGGTIEGGPDGSSILRVTGRLDDVIISGGLKVSLAAIERELRSIPGQHDAVVVSAASERWGEVPVVVTTRALALESLRERMSAVLGRAAAPARVIVLESLPMLSSGKPDRREIRSLAQ